MKLTTQLHLLLRLGMCRAILPHIPSWHVQGNFSFMFTNAVHEANFTPIAVQQFLYHKNGGYGGQ